MVGSLRIDFLNSPSLPMKLAEISEAKILAYVSLLTVLLQLVLMHVGGNFLNRLGEINKGLESLLLH